MKKILLSLIILFLFLPLFYLKAQTNISGIINSYTKVTSLGSANCNDSITVSTTSGFSVGDSVLIIQMQGAVIDSSNTALFGTINSYDNCGNYEFLKITNINGNNIRFSSALKRPYSVTGNVQLVTKPVYSNAVVTGNLNAQPWNGNTGGIITFSATSVLTLNADIDASGTGFRGGNASANYYTAWFYDFCFGSSPGRGGKKGESVAAYITNKEFGRGAPANGGGGGNDINTGAAGGGNYGAGGHGGNNAFSPDTLWGLRSKSLLSGISQSKIFLGGGGGGGHQNNSAGTSGSNGGGIILIYSNNVIGNNHFIKSNGTDVMVVAGIDGAGGGGAGGSVFIDATNFTTNLNIQSKGGKGGDQVYQPQCHGNGGGGGGGVLLFSNSSIPANVITNISAGVQGAGQCNNSVNDAAKGDSGNIILSWHAQENIQFTSTPSVQCNDSHNGSASVIADGIPPYQFVWTFPDGSIISANSISHLSAGNYSLNIINGNGCVENRYFNIGEPSALSVSVTSTNVNCGGPLGSAVANASGGTPPYTYSWNTSPAQFTPTAIDLSPNTYSVTITDSNNCIISDTAIILNNSPVTFTIQSTPATCLSHDGSITVNHNGGSGNFSYRWTPPNDTTLSTLTNLPSGGYSVIATDLSTGCSQSLSTIIGNTIGLAGTVTSFSNATCENGDDGSATISVSGGQPPYHYFWPNGSTSASTNNLAPGSYLVRVEDYNGCPSFVAVNIGFNFLAPVIELGPDTMPCAGTPFLMDGGPGYQSYLWSDNSTNQTLTVLNSGLYTVLVTNTNGCQNFDAINATFITCAISESRIFSNTPKSIILFPNPSTNELNVFGKEIRNTEVTLILSDMLGSQLLFDKTTVAYNYSKKIDLSLFSPGVYMMRISFNDEIISKLFVKQ